METQLSTIDKAIGELVLTVPMRNGNNDLFVWNLKLHIVLTVPMRNGNTSIDKL